MSQLPPPIAALVERARTAHARGKRADAQQALAEAFGLAGYPSLGVDPVYPLPSELSPIARALAEEVVRDHLPAGHQWLPGGVSARRWIGLDPPGPLEREVVVDGRRLPLWRALRDAQDAPRRLAAVEALPPAERLEVAAALDALVWTYRISPQRAQAWELVAGLAGEGRAWALDTMATAPGEEPHAHQLAFFALVRAGVPIDPAWDRFLPIGTHVPPEIAAACAAALPLARLEAVAPALLARTFGPKAIATGTAILRHHDSPVIARAVIETSKRSTPWNRKAELAALAEIARTQPGVAAALAGTAAAAPAARTLTVTWRSAPRAARELTPIMTRQLVEAGRQWDRKTLPAERRLSVDENDEAAIGAVLEYVKLAEHGKPAFDAWLYAGDSGTFFAPNTTKVLALRIQGGIQLASGKRDPALEDALAAIRESKEARRPLAEVSAATREGAAMRAAAKPPAKQPAPAAKKPAAKKPAAKQPAAKKPAAKKPAAKKPAAKKPAAKKPAAKKPAAKKPAPKRPAAKKPGRAR